MLKVRLMVVMLPLWSRMLTVRVPRSSCSIGAALQPKLRPLGDNFELEGEPQAAHTIYSSQDMSTWLPWKTLRDFDGLQTLTDPTAVNSIRKFYKAQRLD